MEVLTVVEFHDWGPIDVKECSSIEAARCNWCSDFEHMRMHACAGEREFIRDLWEAEDQQHERLRKLAIKGVLGRNPDFVWSDDSYYVKGWIGFFYRAKLLFCLLAELSGHGDYHDPRIATIEHGDCYGGWWSNEVEIGYGFGRWYYHIFQDGDSSL